MRRIVPVMSAVALLACEAAPAQGPAPGSKQPAALENVVHVETVARGLQNPWGFAFLPDGRFIVTERPGRVRIVEKDGRIGAPLGNVPAVAASGQGGMLDITLDPDFAKTRKLYLSFAEPGVEGTAGTSVASAVLGEGKLEQLRVIYRQEPKVIGGNHFGSRVVVRSDGTLFITQGDRFAYREQAQDLRVLLGKVVRINTDGTIPKDNPFVGRNDARPEIWSYGHRNMQGAAIDPRTGVLWTIEHGAAGGDELNHPEPGKNYGWPVITYGRDYNGSRIGIGAVKEGMEQPVFYWDPVIAPSGMTFYTGDKYPGWRGSMFVGSMNPGALVRLVIDTGKVVTEERYLHDLRERIRDVQQGPDGYLYMITDNSDGRILRVKPGAN